MEQLTIQSLGFLLGFQEDIKIPGPKRTIQTNIKILWPHGTIKHTVIRVSLGFQDDIKIPWAPGPLAPWNIFHTVFGFLFGFQEDINIIIVVVVVVIIIIIIVILACPDARCESGQTSGSCRNIDDTNNADEINHDNKTCEYYNMVMIRTNPKSCPNNTYHNNNKTVHDKQCLLTMKTINSIL